MDTQNLIKKNLFMLGVVLYKFEKEATDPFQGMNFIRGDLQYNTQIWKNNMMTALYYKREMSE